MTAAHPSLEDFIFVDEIGVSFARRGDFLLKAAYQPIYMRARGGFRPWAVEGSIRAVRVGQDGPPSAGMPQLQDDRFAYLSLALQVRNFRDLYEDGFRLFVNIDLDALADESDALAVLRFLAVEFLRADIDPRRVVCVLKHVHDIEWLPEMIGAARRGHMVLGIENFGIRSLPALEEGMGPDMVRFNPRWLRHVTASPAACRLLAMLVERLHENGTAAIASGIDEAEQLAGLLDAGLCYFQGDLLSRPAVAGSLFNVEPIPIDSVIPHIRNVVPFPVPPSA